MKTMLRTFYKRDVENLLCMDNWPDLSKWLGSILKKIKEIIKENK